MLRFPQLPRRRRSAALAVVSALVLAALTASVPAIAEPSSLFVDRVDVNVVNVEVFVTDKDGRRVPGLAAEDFEIREDGKPVEISNFFAFDRGDAVLRNLEADRRLVLGQPAPPATPAEIPDDQRLNLLVYVDHFNLSPQSKARVLEQLETFTEDRLLQGDYLSLVGYDRRLHVVQPFTRDRAAIERGLAELRKQVTNRQIDEAERRRTMLAMRTSDFVTGYSFLRSYVEKARSELRHSTEALGSVVRSLAGLPGRRAILYVSEGLPMRPGEDLYQYFIDLYGNSNISPQQLARLGMDPAIESIAENEKALFDSVTRHANSHQVTFYTLDARGGGANRALSADQGDLSVSGSGPRALELLRHQSLQEPLLEMALATGGAAVLETFSFERALRQLAGDFDAFYSLGYRSRRGGDGKFHDITVKVLKPGLKVRHRHGYVDKPESERVADRTLSSLLLDLAANPLNVAVDFGKAERKGRNEYHLPVLVRIPFREVTLLPNGDSEEGRLKIFLVVRDEDGDVSKLQEIPYPITVPHAQVAEARDREIGWSTTLAIRPGVPTVAIGVWDELSGVESYVQKKVVVDSKSASRPTQGK